MSVMIPPLARGLLFILSGGKGRCKTSVRAKADSKGKIMKTSSTGKNQRSSVKSSKQDKTIAKSRQKQNVIAVIISGVAYAICAYSLLFIMALLGG